MAELQVCPGGYTHTYCQKCDAIQPAIFDGLDGPDWSGKFVGIDVVCGHCKLVINTLWNESK